MGQQNGVGRVDWSEVLESLRGPGWAPARGANSRVLRSAHRLRPRPVVFVARNRGWLCPPRRIVLPRRISPGEPRRRCALPNRSATPSTRCAPPTLTLPRFNQAQWGRSNRGVGFITAHLDPPAAGGIMAIVISGRRRRIPRLGRRLELARRPSSRAVSVGKPVTVIWCCYVVADGPPRMHDALYTEPNHPSEVTG